jgi:hypothetical protein
MHVLFMASNHGIIGEWSVGTVLEISCHEESEDSLCASRDSNLSPVECMPELTASPACSVALNL